MNVLTVTGRLADDPVRRETPKGVVCEFRLAVDGRPRLYLTIQTWGHSPAAAPNTSPLPASRVVRSSATTSGSPAPVNAPTAGTPAATTSRSSTDRGDDDDVDRGRSERQ